MTEAVIICSANQWTGFYKITASVRKELRKVFLIKGNTVREKSNYQKKKIITKVQKSLSFLYFPTFNQSKEEVL